ncbi:D isomer specific 2 hydroxyacid dehydrogenase NAD binding [Echinococcus multilocularis]|uniref:D isomer specific 2 hydroxyacid dehydrogenase NAD binding n=1 Tax=Echinococcus multilocularis TaxID=6211 RepID=A0A087VY15_ECHMU|nr:D isomer specific 2 hydroxyacid dehydrogenase NAD binding [Echinococcus multilocularis]
MAQLVDFHHRGLPVTPLILLPSGWVYNLEWQTLCPTEETLFDLLDNQCFSAALHFAINHPSPPLSDSLRRPRAVSWFNVEVNPALKNDVVAVVIPIVGWKRTDILQLLETCDKNADTDSDWDIPCYVEIHQCIQGWRLTQLLNLRVVVALPWPDLIPHFGKQNPPKIESAFMDLRSFAKRGITVTVLPNMFEEATRELLLTLLILTLKGYSREVPVPLVNFFQYDLHLPSPLPPPPPPPSPPLTSAKSTSAPILQLPRRPANMSQSLTQNRNAFSPPAALSTTAPPTSLTLATHPTKRYGFRPSNWICLSGPYGSPQLCQKSLREVVVGFLGLITDSAREMAFLLKNGFGMRVMYHQRHPLSGITEIDFEPKMPTFLQNSDVVIIMDDCSDRRASLSKALRSRSPIRQKSTKRSRFILQEEDFRYFKPTGIFISTSPVENFSFAALAMALRNQTLSGAAFTIPMDGSLSSDELQSLHHMKNVIAVPPPSTAGFGPKLLRRQLAGLVLQTISEGLGLPLLGSIELAPPSDLERNFSHPASEKPKSKGFSSLTAKFWSVFRSGQSERGRRQEGNQSVSVR